MANSSRPLRIAYAGTPEFAVVSLDLLLQSRHEVLFVFTQPDRPAGRGHKLQPSPVKRFAQANHIPVYQPKRLGSEAVAMMQDAEIDVLVVAAYGQIVSQEILDTPRFGCINNHASLLPRWRGAAPIVHAILAGDSRTGVTIMQMDSGMDTGAILYQESVSLALGTTQSDLLNQLALAGAKSLVTVLDRLPHYQAQSYAQPEAGVTYAPKITKQQALIDWTKPARDVVLHICAFHGLPMAFTYFNTMRVRVLKARVIAHSVTHDLPPGSVISVTPNAIQVACGEGGVELVCVQMSGEVVRLVADQYRRFSTLFTGGCFSSRVD